MSPAKTSLHDLSVENPGFAVHPFFWTASHLRLVNCRFEQVNDNLLTEASQNETLTGYAEKLATRCAPSLKPAYVVWLLVRKGSPLTFVQGNPTFYFDGYRVRHEKGCDIYRIDNNKLMQQPEPIIGYYLYDVDSARQKRLSAPRAPCGLNNEAVERIYERRLSGITPEDWRNDPYLVCLLLSLAQFQWYQGKTKGQKVFPAHLLVTKESDKEYAYVFKTDVPDELLKSLHYPSRSFDKFPPVTCTKVSFKPYATFPERIVLHLIGHQYASKLGAVTAAQLGGQKRKFDDIEEPSQTARKSQLCAFI
ncbi:hypothetical protein ACLX1H_011258 [Fusarium chlamydosporum]